jgi:hypothetical protein
MNSDVVKSQKEKQSEQQSFPLSQRNKRMEIMRRERERKKNEKERYTV